jgi:hypothetical protein
MFLSRIRAVMELRVLSSSYGVVEIEIEERYRDLFVAAFLDYARTMHLVSAEKKLNGDVSQELIAGLQMRAHVCNVHVLPDDHHLVSLDDQEGSCDAFRTLLSRPCVTQVASRTS